MKKQTKKNIIMATCAIGSIVSTIYFLIKLNGLDAIMISLFGLSILIGTIVSNQEEDSAKNKQQDGSESKP